ncbi:DUF1178 family protein [Robbsia sp. KACC 23696]|uniref:DUF1178 family protein n=1 Tax=Robbsia sp. KACC 23696 TaxID=3149231 RepID=UPI00325B7615
MKVFDLQCAREHRFEGWFASADAYDTQREKGLLQCPMCGSSSVQRLPSAPHLNVSSLRADTGASASGSAAMEQAMARRAGDDSDARQRAAQQARGAEHRGGSDGALSVGGARRGIVAGGGVSGVGGTPEAKMAEALQAAWLKMAREVIRQTENVGDAFADEARRIHYDEAPARAIRGHATAEQVAELADEGIDVLPLPMPDAAKETLQ